MAFFVNQKRHQTNGSWLNNIHVKEEFGEAMHQFHAFLSTYGYGFAEGVDYAACSVETDGGRFIKNEVDDRRAPVFPDEPEAPDGQGEA